MIVKFKPLDQTKVAIENVDRAYDQRSDNICPPGKNVMSETLKRVAVFDDLSPYANDVDILVINGKLHVETFYLTGNRHFKACLNTLHEISGWKIQIEPNDLLYGGLCLEVHVPYDVVEITL